MKYWFGKGIGKSLQNLLKYMRQESITINYSCLRAATIMSSRCLFNLSLPEECMHIALSFIGVFLQSGSGVLSQRVYIAHD